MNISTRFVIGLHISSWLDVLLRVVNMFIPVDDRLHCTVLGALLTYTGWLMFSYNFSIALWLFLYIFFGKKLRSLPRTMRIAKEVITHVLCFITALFWVLLPLTTAPQYGVVFGKAGIWCWIRSDRMGSVWRMAAFYVPLWITTAIVVILYACCLFFVFRSYYLLYAHEMRGVRSSSVISKFSHQMFLVIRNDGSNRTVIRISDEWKAYTRLILYPVVFMIVVFFPTLLRITEYFGTTIPAVQLLARLFVAQLGLLLVIVYFINPVKLFMKLRSLLLCDPCRNRSRKSGDGVVVMDLSLRKDVASGGSDAVLGESNLSPVQVHDLEGVLKEETEDIKTD